MASLENNDLGVVDDDEYFMSDSEEDLFAEIEDNTFQWHKRKAPFDDCLKFPEHIKSKQNMGIKDVIKEHALHFLPAKSLCRFRTVSKEWDQWISTPFFQHKQAQFFQEISGFFCQFPGEDPSFISCNPRAYGVPIPSLSFLPEPVTIRTSCNGLLCCQSYDGDNAYYVCNPANKEWKVLPKPKFYHGPGSAVALAFEPSTLNFSENYELICAIPDNPIVRFEIYSSRSSSWRLADTVCCEALTLSGDGFYMKGMVYWETVYDTILAFDVKNEEFGILYLPPESGPQGVLTERHGELCYVLPQEQGNEYTISIYGDFNMKLKHKFTLDHKVFGYFSGELRALPCLNDDALVILHGNRMSTYHVGAQQVEMLSVVRTDGFVRYHPYVNSLVPVGCGWRASSSLNIF